MNKFRYYSRFLPLIITAVAWLIIETRAEIDAGLLPEFNASLLAVRVYFVISVIGLISCYIFAERLRRWFHENNHAQMLALALAGLASFAVVNLVTKSQSARLFQFPPTLWITMMHVIFLGLCMAVLVTPRNTALPQRRGILVYLTVVGAVLGLVHILSVGEFMQFDIPDEPWLVSAATNFALHGNFSPSYIASSFGTPDPAIARYYFAMGLWLRLVNSTSHVALRAFPAIIAAIAVIMAFYAFSRINLSRIQTAIGLIILMSLSAFVRTSHNLRMDIGLAVYGVLVVWGLLSLLNDRHPQRWSIILGLGLYIGLESVPFAGLPLGIAIGIILIVRVLIKPDKRNNSQYVFIYAAASAIACLAYLSGHFLPDIEASIDGFRRFFSIKSNTSNLGMLRNPFATMQSVYIPFSLTLSPPELLTIAVSLLLIWRSRVLADRLLMLTMLIAALLMLIFTSTSYGYWALFTPFFAYIAARTVTTGLAVRIWAFVLIPALVAAPIHDMVLAVQRQSNQNRVTDIVKASDIFEPGSTILGEPLFWFALHQNHNYIGWTAVGRYNGTHQTTYTQFLEIFKPDSLICWIDSTNACERAEEVGYSRHPTEIVVGSHSYLVWQRSD